jgi:hypothetical protein
VNDDIDTIIISQQKKKQKTKVELDWRTKNESDSGYLAAASACDYSDSYVYYVRFAACATYVRAAITITIMTTCRKRFERKGKG